MSGLSRAVTFLTRVPLRERPAKSTGLAQAIPWFPVVGALVGASVAGVYAAASLAFPAFVAATIGIGFGVVLTGAFHEDGLGDTADALAGGWTREERLQIMRDPRLGTYGVAAVTISLLLRISALSTLGAWEGVAALIAAHALGRAAAIGLLGVLSPVGDGGLGTSYAAASTPRGITGALALGAVVGSLALGLLSLPAIVVAAAAAGTVALIARRSIGGLTGDVLGAAEQMVEVLVLLLATAAATNDWASVAWWQ